MPDKRCGTCRWWEQGADNSVRGDCHGGPPTAMPDASRRGLWPQTRADDWCGEWTPTVEAADKAAIDRIRAQESIKQHPRKGGCVPMPDDPTPIDATADGVHHVMRFGVVELTECCDCGLVHRELFVPDPECPSQLHVYSWRDDGETTAAHKRNGGKA